MRDSLGTRIALAYAALMIACVGALIVYLVGVGERSYLNTLQAGVESDARMVAVAVRPLLLSSPRATEIDRLAKQLGTEAGVRVTIVDQGGTVRGDSEHDPDTMENHGDRPEILDAQEKGLGISRRHSDTLGYDTLYAAVPVKEGSQLLGTARVALPLAGVNQREQEIGWAMALGGIVATALAVVLATVIARGITGPIAELTAAATRMSRGDLEHRVGLRSRDEVGQLATAFDRMADRLRGTIKDISSERNTLSTILSTMADGLLIVDGLGKVTLANPAAASMLRANRADLAGRTHVEALRDHDLSAALSRCLEEGTQQSAWAEVGAGRRYLRIVAAPLRGDHQGALALIQDLTDVRRADTVKRDFVANVSHELRTPLASLKALVETLEEGAIHEPEIALDFLSKMHGEVDGLAQLVSELLELSRIESRQAAMRTAPVKVEAIAQGVARRLTAQAERAGVALEVEVPKGMPAVVADEGRIEQVLVNLIHNAIKFTPSGGRIRVGASWGDGKAVIRVADTGAGIAEEDIPRIFERFYKSDRSRSGGGTGLGLAISRHLVEAQGGRIWAESRPGEGSTFSFTLPLAPDSHL